MLTFTANDFSFTPEINNYYLLHIKTKEPLTLNNTLYSVTIKLNSNNEALHSFTLCINPLSILITNPMYQKLRNSSAQDLIITLIPQTVLRPSSNKFNLILAEDLGIAAAYLFITNNLSLLQNTSFTIFGATSDFPCKLQPSTMIVPNVSSEVIAGATILEDLGLPNRIASLIPKIGTFTGHATILASSFLNQLHDAKPTQLYAFGTNEFGKLCQSLAIKHNLSIEKCLLP